MLSDVEWHDALEKGDIVEQHFVTLHFSVVILMNDASQMNVSADYRSGLIGRLATVNLIVNVGSIKLRRECGELDCPIALELPAKKKTRNLFKNISFRWDFLLSKILSHPSLNVT